MSLRTSGLARAFVLILVLTLVAGCGGGNGGSQFGTSGIPVPFGLPLPSPSSSPSPSPSPSLSPTPSPSPTIRPSQVALSASVNPSIVGQPVTFSVTVSGSAAGGPTPTGTVTFSDNAVALGQPVVLSGGQATLQTASLAAGLHTITATYSGDSVYQASSSAPLSQTVNANIGGPSVGSSANPSTVSQSVTFTAIVTPVPPATATPTGTVTFLDGGASLSGPVALSGGQATFTTSLLAVGSHPITVTYSGDSAFAPATSPVLGQTVNAGAALTSVMSSQNPSSSGLTVNFTATVAPIAPASVTPSGTVTFMDGATPLGAPVVLSGGQATLGAPALATRTHPITAMYGGDANFGPSTSAPLSQTVNPTSLAGAGGVSADQAGNAVAISADGRTVVVGAPFANLNQGAAYVFFDNGTAWVQQAELSTLVTIQPLIGVEQFGTSVAVSGNTVVVGGPQANGTVGRAYVFTFNNGAWTERAELDEAAGVSTDFFGSSVAIDGNTIMVGATGFVNSMTVSIGAVWVYNLAAIPLGTASTATIAELDNPQVFSPGNFGANVALSGTTAVIGASANISAASSNTGGTAYVFTGPGGIWSSTPAAELGVAILDATAGYGASVAISGDASTIVVGAPVQSNHGDAFVFVGAGAAWTQQAQLAPLISPFFADDNIGFCVAVSGNLAMAGSPNQNNSIGAAYLFSRTGTVWSLQRAVNDPSARPGDIFSTSMAMSGFNAVFGTPETFTSPSALSGRGWFEILGP